MQHYDKDDIINVGHIPTENEKIQHSQNTISTWRLQQGNVIKLHRHKAN